MPSATAVVWRRSATLPVMNDCDAASQPESVIRIKSVFLLYVERILVSFFAGMTGYTSKNRIKKAHGKQTDG